MGLQPPIELSLVRLSHQGWEPSRPELWAVLGETTTRLAAPAASGAGPSLGRRLSVSGGRGPVEGTRTLLSSFDLLLPLSLHLTGKQTPQVREQRLLLPALVLHRSQFAVRPRGAPLQGLSAAGEAGSLGAWGDAAGS